MHKWHRPEAVRMPFEERLVIVRRLFPKGIFWGPARQWIPTEHLILIGRLSYDVRAITAYSPDIVRISPKYPRDNERCLYQARPNVGRLSGGVMADGKLLLCVYCLLCRNALLYTATDWVYIVRPMPGRCPVLAGLWPADVCNISGSQQVQADRTSVGYFPMCKQTSAGYRPMSGPKNFSPEAVYTGRLPLVSRPDIGRYLNDVWRICGQLWKCTGHRRNFNFELKLFGHLPDATWEPQPSLVSGRGPPKNG